MVWERRWNPLREEWVTITGHRNSRPWSSPEKKALHPRVVSYDSDCGLCPGNIRISGERNPQYEDIFVFDNDHPAFKQPSPPREQSGDSRFVSASAGGVCRVLCYSPKHNRNLSEFSVDQTRKLIDVWIDQTDELKNLPGIEQVLIFENRGELVGVSNSHPHGQIYATEFLMEGIRKESMAFEKASEPLMQSLLSAELRDGRRVIYDGSEIVSFVPYFAKFPYEVFIVPRSKHRFVSSLSSNERNDLARALNDILRRYDNMWGVPFPYMLLFHQSPCNGNHLSYHSHIQIHPILRAPNLPKYLASVETGAGHFLNDGSPEDKAAELRAVALDKI